MSGTEDQRDPLPPWWPLVRLILATAVTVGGVCQATAWYMDGYPIAATIVGAAVLGALAGLYPHD